MEIIQKAYFHRENGSNVITERPELEGIQFENFKQKEEFRKSKIKEIFGYLNNDIPEGITAYLIFHTKTIPDNYEPPQKVVKTANTIPQEDYDSIPEFISRKPSIH